MALYMHMFIINYKLDGMGWYAKVKIDTSLADFDDLAEED